MWFVDMKCSFLGGISIDSGLFDYIFRPKLLTWTNFLENDIFGSGYSVEESPPGGKVKLVHKISPPD